MSKSILIVEDSIIQGTHLRLLLAQFYQVVGICESGEDALEFLKYTHVDLIIMDIDLKGALSGIDTACLINKQQAAPIMFLSGNLAEVAKKHISRTTNIGLMPKPYNEEFLISCLQDFFELGVNIPTSSQRYIR